MFLHRLGKVRAPEFPNGLLWLNGKGVSLKKLAGKPVLVDFWTYSCVNCQRTLPYIQKLYERYQEMGLMVVGVHTPEFAFEREEANVQRAILEAGISYSVVLDNDYDIWHLYANNAWPHCFLIGHDGVIIYDHVGEGGYAETEKAVQMALIAAGVNKLMPEVLDDELDQGSVCYKTTPELYLGYLRGKYGNTEEYLPDAPEAFTCHGVVIPDLPYLHGHWLVSGEYVEHSKELAVASEYLAVEYSAFGVNIVATAGEIATIVVELDGLPLPDDMLGSDMKRAKDGSTVMKVHEARMYNLVESSTYHQGTLKILTKNEGVRFYAFTFDGCNSILSVDQP
jgi:thiol-disulfide isomerase/thioredoxin